MYCSKCGKEIPDSSSFCNACGAAVGAVPAKQGISIVSKVSVSRIAVLVSNVLILWLCFKDWIVVDTSIIYSKFTSLRFADYVERIADWGIGDIEALQVGSAALLILNIVVILITGVYVVKDIVNDDNKLNWGYGSAEGTIAVIVALIVVSFFTREEGFVMASNIYTILALAAVNRFLILPRYASDEYWKMQAERKREREAKKEKPNMAPVRYQNDRWKCPDCGEENERTALTCKNCSRYK